MSLPVPRPGMVISYAYLWADEHRVGREDGAKDRPCAIVAARQVIEGREIVTVIPVTHSPPRDTSLAMEIPAAIKFHLGLDEGRSWIVLSETNDFVWPGPDLRPIGSKSPKRFDYGMLPPRFFQVLRQKVLELNAQNQVSRVPRSE